MIGYEPYEGRREVRLRAARRVLIRLPDTARSEDAELWVDGARRDPVWRGAYADAGYLGAGQVAVLRYPLREVTERLEVNRQMLTVHWKGSTVIEVQSVGGDTNTLQPRGAGERRHALAASADVSPPGHFAEPIRLRRYFNWSCGSRTHTTNSDYIEALSGSRTHTTNSGLQSKLWAI